MKNIFPNKEVGDFLNNKVIFLKYELDINDPNNIVKNYNIKAYPTFLILNGDGKEVNRVLGGGTTPEPFLKYIKDGLNPKNSLIEYEKRFKADVNTGIDYIKYLKDAFMHDKAEEVAAIVMTKRSAKANFTPENMEFFKKKMITSTDSYIFNYLIDKKSINAIKEAIGSEEYSRYVSDISNGFATKIIAAEGGVNSSELDKFIAIAKANSVLQTPFTKFVIENRDIIVNNDLAKLLPLATDKIKEIKSDDRMISNFISFAKHIPSHIDKAQYKAELIYLYEAALENSEGEYYKMQYKTDIYDTKRI